MWYVNSQTKMHHCPCTLYSIDICAVEVDSKFMALVRSFQMRSNWIFALGSTFFSGGVRGSGFGVGLWGWGLE